MNVIWMFIGTIFLIIGAFLVFYCVKYCIDGKAAISLLVFICLIGGLLLLLWGIFDFTDLIMMGDIKYD